MLRRAGFRLTDPHPVTLELLAATDHRVLARWAIECARRVQPYFEASFPDDKRPRNALKTLQAWIDTGVFSMAVIRKASLDSHAAARDVGEDSPARSAARAAGQAVATAHVPRHALGSALYALQALYRANPGPSADDAIATERRWQYERLLAMRAEAGSTARRTIFSP